MVGQAKAGKGLDGREGLNPPRTAPEGKFLAAATSRAAAVRPQAGRRRQHTCGGHQSMVSEGT